jgi:hypothetical protein
MINAKRDMGIPAAFAAALTAAKPGMRGPLTGSMMTSESRDWPTSAASPVRMPATCHHLQCINDDNNNKNNNINNNNNNNSNNNDDDDVDNKNNFFQLTLS